MFWGVSGLRKEWSGMSNSLVLESLNVGLNESLVLMRRRGVVAKRQISMTSQTCSIELFTYHTIYSPSIAPLSPY